MYFCLAKNDKLKDKKILLLDGAPPFKGYDKDGYSNRVFAINQNTVNLMKEIDVWDTIKSIRYQPVKQMQVNNVNLRFNHFNQLFVVLIGLGWFFRCSDHI